MCDDPCVGDYFLDIVDESKKDEGNSKSKNSSKRSGGKKSAKALDEEFQQPSKQDRSKSNKSVRK